MSKVKGTSSFCLAVGMFLVAQSSFALRDDRLAAAPATKPNPVPAAARRAPGEDQKLLAKLAEADGIVTRWHSKLGTPSSVRGKGLGKQRAFSGGKGLQAKNDASEADAVAVVDNLSGICGVEDAAQEFAADPVKGDEFGFRHVRLRQLRKGLRVVGGQLIVHFRPDGEACEVNGSYVPNIDIGLEPKITGNDATEIVLRDLGPTEPPVARVSKPELVIYALGNAPVLAYELTVFCEDGKTEPQRWRCWIAAADGAVLLRYNDVRKVAEPTANGSDASISGSVLAGEGGVAVNVTGWRENTGIYYLYGKDLHWCVYNVATTGAWSDKNTYAYRATSGWGVSDRAEMSAARNFKLVQTYFKQVHNRNSFDSSGAEARADVHDGSSYVNAYWDGEFHFGDGDGVTADPLAVLDIVGHEFTHAVTEYTAGLQYINESGALDESFSDIFGACLEFYGQPDGRNSYPNVSPGTGDWLLGEDCWISSKSLRDMRDPGNQQTVGSGNELPSRYNGTYWYHGADDNGGVHVNCGVQNFMFYLLCEGGSGANDGISYNVTGIGVTNAARIAYRALTLYCTPNTDYEAVRGAWVSAATDLNPGWVDSVNAAWNAAGVSAGSAAAVATPTFDPPPGAYGSAVTVTVVTATADASIFYSLNGGEPTESSSLYTSPLVVPVNTTIKAKAFKSGLSPSETAVAIYSSLGSRMYYFPMDSSPGWTTEGQWAFGKPTGGGGEHGSPDPDSGYSGQNVYGYNLSGDYANDMSATHWLTTAPLDLSSAASVRLLFRRWLGVERPAYDHATVEISTNGSSWTHIWGNSAEVADNGWTRESLDITSIAARQRTVYIRWGMGPTDDSWEYCGWNIDDVEIWEGGGLGDAMDAPKLAWTTGGDASWFGQTAVTHDGMDAATSGEMGDAAQTWMKTTVEGPGTLGFWWKVSSESGYDYLQFHIDGVEQAGRISGEVDWQRKTFSVPAGSHTLQWTYTKDASVARGADCGWVDQATFTPLSGLARLYWQIPSGRAYHWLLDRDGKQAAGSYLSQADTTWVIRSAGDIDKDGVADLIWQLPAGKVYCWLMSSNGTQKSAFYIHNATTAWQVRAAGDINGDGVADLIWQLPTGQVLCWLMTVNGTPKSVFYIHNKATTWRVRAAGDINGDGVADLIWQLPAGQVLCWLMTVNGTQKSAFYIHNATTAWQVRAAGDINGDGVADLVWQLPTGQVCCWFMNSNGGQKSGFFLSQATTIWIVRTLGK